MEFPTDAKFSNVELAPGDNMKGMLYVPVKNNFQTYEPFVPLSVFDKHPDIVGKYRKEPVLRYNELRENWEINPYFLESNFLSATVQEPGDGDIDQDDIEIPQISVYNPVIEMQGAGTVHTITISLDKAYKVNGDAQSVTLTIGALEINEYLTYTVDSIILDAVYYHLIFNLLKNNSPLMYTHHLKQRLQVQSQYLALIPAIYYQ